MNRHAVALGIFILLSSHVAADADRVTAARAVASAHLRDHAKSYGIDCEADLREYSVTEEPEYRLTHFKYSQVYQGLPVLYSQLFLHVKDSGTVREQNMLKSPVGVDPIVPRILATDAAAFAARDHHMLGQYDVTASILAILPRRSIDGRPQRDRLVWQVTIHAENDVEPFKAFEAVVDAIDGTVWTSYSLVRELTLKNLNPGQTVIGIGPDVAGKLWYRMFSTYLPSNADHAALKQAFIFAAGDVQEGPANVLATVNDASAAINL